MSTRICSEPERPRDVERKRLMYGIYYIAGGIYKSDGFSNFQKYLWLNVNFLIALLIVLGGIGYLITTNSYLYNMRDVASVLWTTGVTIFTMIIFPYITSYYHQNFEELFKYIECNVDNIQTLRRNFRDPEFLPIERNEPSAEASSWMKLIWIVYASHVLLPVIDVLFFVQHKNEAIRTVLHHIIGIPYLDRTHSLYIFLGLYFIEMIIFTFMHVIALSEPPLIIMIASELNSIVVSYCKRMQLLSDRYVNEMERHSLLGCQHYDCMEKLSHDFVIDLRSLVQRYQKLVKTIKLIQPFVQIFNTALLVINFFALSSNILMLLLTDFQIFLTLKLVSASVLCLGYLYPHCRFGTTINTMSEAVVEQIYNLPWYSLPPKQRKVIYIFLNQSQQSIIFKAFGTFPVDIILFPKVLRLAYSFVNVLAATSGRNPK